MSHSEGGWSVPLAHIAAIRPSIIHNQILIVTFKQPMIWQYIQPNLTSPHLNLDQLDYQLIIHHCTNPVNWSKTKAWNRGSINGQFSRNYLKRHSGMNTHLYHTPLAKCILSSSLFTLIRLFRSENLQIPKGNTITIHLWYLHQSSRLEYYPNTQLSKVC